MLLDSAISVFADKGFEATSITDITTQAGLADGMFYNYYHDKQELLGAVATGLAIEITSRINDEMDGVENAIVSVATATARILDTVRQEPEWVEVLLGGIRIVPVLQSSVVQFLKKDLELGVTQNRFNAEIDVLLVNQVLSLISTAVLLDGEQQDATVRRTCEAVLILLGVASGKAAVAVTKVLDR